MNRSHGLGPLLLVGAIALAGCTAEYGRYQTVGRRPDGGGGSAVRASSEAGRASTAAAAPAQPSRRADAAPREGGSPGRFQLAYPTGDRQTSLLLLEVDSPPEVRVGRPYRYTVRVTNLTETPLHGVAVRDAGAAI